MEKVKADRNLSRWEEMETAAISPADVYKILKVWKENDSFDTAHISAISRDVARSLNDLMETPEGGSIVYHEYNHSYTDSDKIIAMYGDRLVSFYEMRDDRGYLKQWRVVLNSA